jgi:hypothetical protein
VYDTIIQGASFFAIQNIQGRLADIGRESDGYGRVSLEKRRFWRNNTAGRDEGAMGRLFIRELRGFAHGQF